jgi:hypothetical protein
MSVNLSLLAGAGWQFFTDDGVPLSGGLLYTYAAGTTTPLATYTSSTGLTANTNPIVLNSAGRVANQIWLTTGSAYKFVLQTSAAVQIYSQDNISGENDPTAIYAALAASSGSSLIGFIQTGTGAVARTAQAKMRDVLDVRDFGVIYDGSAADTTRLLAAITAATAAQATLYMPSGTMALNGATRLSIDISLMSLNCDGTILECTNMLDSYAMQVFGSQTYPVNYRNSQHKVSGFALVGTSTTNRNGILVGHPTYTQNNQLEIADFSIYNFDKNLELTSNCWRPRFVHGQISNGKTFHVYADSGLTNFGEEITFDHVQISDGTGIVSCGTTSFWAFHSCSVLNVPMTVASADSEFRFYGSNVENPANATPYVYGTVSGARSSIKFYGTTIIANSAATFTNPIFVASGSDSFIDFNGCHLPGGGHLQFYTGLGYNVLVNGLARSVNGDMTPGAANIVPSLTKVGSALANGDYETGNINGWTATAYGAGGSTAVASATAKKNGTYGLLVTTVASGGINTVQTKTCAPGAYVVLGAWAKVATSGGTPNGYLQIAFNDALGNQLQVGGNEISIGAFAAFTWSSFVAIAPAGTATVQCIINGQASAAPNILYFDEVVMNIL